MRNVQTEEQVKNKVKAKQLAKVIDYQKVFGSPEGKKVLKDLMQYANFLRTSVIVGDSHQTHFEEGKRDVVLRIMRILKTDYEALREQLEERETE